MTPYYDEQLVIGETQDFVRREQAALALTLGLAIFGYDLGDCHGLAHGHGGAYPDAHVAAALGEVLGGDVVCAAEHELHVGVADDLGSEVVRAAVLELAEALHGLVLQYLQPRAEAEHNAGAHRVAGLSKQVVRRAGRMVERQLLKERRELALTVANKHLVDRGEVFLVRRPARIKADVEYERLE